MSLLSISVPNLIQGISQQPPQMRLPSQLADQVNAYPSLAEGLTKRPPTNHVANLASDAPDQFVHFIVRDATERYIVRITSSGLRVFAIDGTEKSVFTTQTGTTAFSLPSYLNTSSVNLRAITIADYTFLLNRSTVTAMSSTVTSAAPNEALVTVAAVGYSVNYTVTFKVGSSSYTYTQTSGSGVPISTETIATNLVAAVNAATATTGLTATSYGSTFLVSGTSAFTVKVSDSTGGTYLVCASGKVSKLSDLPKQGKHGFKIAVGASADGGSDTDYYVSFVANDGVSGTGYWKEDVGFGVQTTIDPSTMPYVLVRRSDGNFACYQSTWTGRTAGDATTARTPSFIGRAIKDIFLFRNRLGVVADDKVVLSESGYYFNFFRTTTTQIIDSDPIDVSVGHAKIASLQTAIPWDERLILFSPLTQFSLGSGNDAALTPNTVQVTQTTEFVNACEICRPEATGRSLLFFQRKGSFAGVREYIRISAREQYDGIDLTANVPSLIAGTPRQIAVSSHDSVGFVRTDTGLYNYKWFVNGNEKVQSAWSRWDLGTNATVAGMGWIDHSLYLVIARGSKTVLERVDFSGKFQDSPLLWGIHLDRRQNVTATTTGASAGSTRLANLTVDYTGLGPVVVIDGIQRLVTAVASTYVEVSGSFDGKSAWVGIPYTMSWTFSTPYLRNNGDAVIDGRLQLTYGRLAYESTGHFIVTVSPKYRDPYTYVFDGGFLGADIQIGSAFIGTDSYRFPIHCRTEDVVITVTSASWMPCRFQSAAFEARFTTRSRPT
jgi:hypothetical protein